MTPPTLREVTRQLREYHGPTGYHDNYGSFCEHCDSDADWRRDTARGNVCRDCDSALDEMFGEQP